MRLIDADALADALFEKRKNYPQWVADTIGAMPDAIVRCKDCLWNSGTEEKPYCQHHDESRNTNWFCADGELRS